MTVQFKNFRYAWARNPLETVKANDISGLPFDRERNHTWSLAYMYEIHTGKKTKTPDLPQRNEHNELMKALQKADLQGRGAETKEFLKTIPAAPGN